MTPLRLVAVLASLLAGCARAATPRAPGEVRVILPQMPNTLDWNTSNETSWVNFPVLLAVMHGLTELGPDHAVRPGLAARWDGPARTPEGHEVYTFHLRDDATWSDGAPVEARDFVLGWRRALEGAEGEQLADVLGARAALDLRARNATAAEIAAALDRVGVEALDPRTLRVTLTQPRSYFLAELANVYVFFPAPAHDLEHATPEGLRDYFDRPENGRPLAVGPFRVQSWDRAAEVIRLARNPRSVFAPPARPGVAPVETLTLHTSEVGPSLFRRGEAEFVSIDAAAGIRAAHEAQGEGRGAHQPLLSTYFLALNTRRPPLERVEFRRAIARAIDPAGALARLVPDARLARTLLPPDLPGAATPAQVDALPRFDREQSRALLTAAGGSRRPLRLLFDGSPGIVPQAGIARRIQKQLAAVGIEVELDERQDDYGARRAAGEFDLYLRRIGADYAHPQTFFSVFARGGNSATGWEGLDGGALAARFEALLARADGVADPAGAREVYGEAERVLLEDAAVIVPLYHPDRYYFVAPRVLGVGVDPFNFISLGSAQLRAGGT